VLRRLVKCPLLASMCLTASRRFPFFWGKVQMRVSVFFMGSPSSVPSTAAALKLFGLCARWCGVAGENV